MFDRAVGTNTRTMTDNENLCSLCQTVIAANVADVTYPHHKSSQSLYQSGHKGCPLCAMVWDSFCHGIHSSNDPSDKASDASSFTFKLLDFRTEDKRMGDFFYVFERECDGQAHDVATFLPRLQKKQINGAYTPGPNIGSAEALNMATRWVQHCVKNHTRCNRAAHEKLLPTRVLDVGTADDPHLKLHISNEASSSSLYVTLSHCWGSWGGKEIKRLTTANLHSLTMGIDIFELPKTFQDAIVVARHLGVQFLWIDSLCIIQGSGGDWAAESAKMADVYSNSFCNISATAAVDGRTGCFLERDPLLAQICMVRINPSSDFTSNSKVYELAPPRLWDSQVTRAPVNHRAWVVQERFLAPRIIHFCRNQLFWECHEAEACEMYPEDIYQLQMVGTPGFKHTDPATDGPIIGREIALLGLMDPSQVLEAGVSAFQIWNRILELYSSCLLTHRQDKLVAISAIAKHFAPILDDEYIAGLWRRHLPQHLLWKVKTPSKFAPSHSSTENFYAPSWSWASYNGEIRPYSELVPHEKPVMIDILDVKIMAKTSDPTGQVDAGCYIKIRGWLKRFSSLKLVQEDSDTEDSASEIDKEAAWELKLKHAPLAMSF